MTSLLERVNARLAGEVPQEPQHRQYKPHVYQFPQDVAIPCTKVRVPIVAKDAGGTVYLAGRKYTEVHRTDDRVWEFHTPEDFMSWAYAEGHRFRPELSPHDGKEFRTIEVYIEDDYHIGTGLKTRWDGDSIYSVRYGKDGVRHRCLGYLMFHKGSIIGVDRDTGEIFEVEELLGIL